MVMDVWYGIGGGRSGGVVIVIEANAPIAQAHWHTFGCEAKAMSLASFMMSCGLRAYSWLVVDNLMYASRWVGLDSGHHGERA